MGGKIDEILRIFSSSLSLLRNETGTRSPYEQLRLFSTHLRHFGQSREHRTFLPLQWAERNEHEYDDARWLRREHRDSPARFAALVRLFYSRRFHDRVWP